MASISANGNLIAVARAKEVQWRNSRASSFTTLHIPFEVTFEKKPDTENCTEKPVEYFIRDISFSENGIYFAVLTSSKELFIHSSNGFVLTSKHQLPRAASKATFSMDSQYILVADKTGDALIFKTGDSNDLGKKICGHLSLLTDILMSRDNRYIITCDRDEKIKVSNYPGTYNVESFCLGHTEFITSLHFLPHNEKYLISSSGDGTVRIWDYICGREICVIDVHKDLSDSGIFTKFKDIMKMEDVDIKSLPINYTSCCKIEDNSSLIAVSLYLSKTIFMYRVTDEEVSTLKCKLLSKLMLEICPYSCLIERNTLWIYYRSEVEVLQEWKFTNDGDSFVEGSTEVFEENCPNRTQCDSDNISMLYKRKFDNLQEYQKRKKQRLEGQSN